MLSLFRTNQLAFSLFLIVYAVLLRIAGFFVPQPIPVLKGKGVFSDACFDLLGEPSSVHLIAAILLVFLQAIALNIIVAKFRMAKEISLFPGLCYILLSSAIPEFLYLSPLLLANTFIILALQELFNTYRRQHAAGIIFNLGFWIAIASLFYVSSMLFLIIAIIGLNILRAFRPNELLVLLLGFLVPYLLTGTYYFWTDQLPYFIQTQFVANWGFLDFVGTLNWESYVKLSLFGLLLVIGLFSYGAYTAKKNIQAQKNISILYWVLLFGTLTLGCQNELTLNHLLVLVVPFAIFLALSFQNLSAAAAEAIHLLFLVGILILQFKPMLG